MLRNPLLHPGESSRLKALIASYDLEPARDLITQNASPCVSLLRGKKVSGSRVGESRYGGTPDLSDPSRWPRNDNGYYGFFMQLNLEDVPAMDSSPLPANGLFSFFFADDWPAELVASCPVIYQPDCSQLQRTKPCTEDELIRGELYCETTPHRVDFQLGIDLPHYGTDLYWAITEVVGDKKAGDRYFALIRDAINIPTGQSRVGQLLGYSSELNGDMRSRAVQRDTRKSNVEGWRLLWNIGSDFEVGICVGDAGQFYTLIHQDDLRKGVFNRTYTELEV
jgi:uncharacterized protein YwqG